MLTLCLQVPRLPSVRIREPPGQAQVADTKGILKVPRVQRRIYRRLEPPARLQQLDAPLVPQRPRTPEEGRVVVLAVAFQSRRCCG
jgi:hypothetical protein